MALLYQGFTQDANVRSFQFEHAVESRGRKTTRIRVIVKADLSQLMMAHVAVQDGPALCVHVLTTLLANTNTPLPLMHTITTEDLAAFVGLRAVRTQSAPHRRRRAPKPSVASQLHWTRL